MKYIFSFVLLVVFCFQTQHTFAQNPGDKVAKGISFNKGSWNELLSDAKKNKKPFFVDVYTTWCGPCKKMSKETFQDAEVGKYINSNFLAYKLDAEKGEGVGLSEKFDVEAYPTILFFNADGKLLGKEEGFMDSERFIFVAEKYKKKAK